MRVTVGRLRSSLAYSCYVFRVLLTPVSVVGLLLERITICRYQYVDKYYTHHPDVPIFCNLMNMTLKSKNVKLAKFISCIFELF